MIPIEIGDTVHHKPSGEDWLVARVDDEHVWPLGWPPCRADRADCVLLEKTSAEEREELKARLRKFPKSDERHLPEST